MEKSGLIQNYTVITDDALLGNDITVLMEISMEHPGITMILSGR